MQSNYGRSRGRLLTIRIASLCALGAVVLQILALFGNDAKAQIIPDSTLPNNSRIRAQDNIRIIEGGTRSGSNLFHSFQQFSVLKGSEAHFNNALDIQNIISRVTGGSVSNIDGLISANGTANVFLINPLGIIFGENARLDVGGSFIGTTAHGIEFGNQGFFSAIDQNPPPSVLTVKPSAFLFNQIANQRNHDIQVNQASLSVPNGQSLLLVGGNVSLDKGQLSVPGGRVELAGLAAAGKVELNFTGNNPSLSFPDSVQRANVSLTNGTQINVTDKGQGSVALTGGNIDILGGSFGGSTISAGIGEKLARVGSPPAGDITLNATGVVTINYPSRVTNVVAKNARGDAGNINIKAGEIYINNVAPSKPTLETDPPSIPAALDTGSMGQGRAGNISLSTTGSISVVGQDKSAGDQVISTDGGGQIAGNISLKANGFISLDNAFFVASNNGGNGGNIFLHGDKSVSLANNSSLVSASTAQGNSGSIIVESSGPVSFQNTLVNTSVARSRNKIFGNAGNITILGQSVSVTGGSELTARSEGAGNAGKIQINAIDKVDISGNKPSGLIRENRDRAGTYINTTLTTATQDGGRGNAGDISIKAGTISINNQASSPALNASTLDQDLQGNLTRTGRGRSGNVSLEATGSISLIGQDVKDSDQVISTFGEKGSLGSGNISLIANGSISLSDAFLKASSNSEGGNAGSISLEGKESVSLANNSSLVTASFIKGNSGNITVQSSGPISFQNSLVNTAIGSPSATSTNSTLGDAGNITIKGRSVSVTDGTEISARSFNGASPGNIRVDAADSVEISGRTPLLPLYPPPMNARSSTVTYSALLTTSEANAGAAGGNISVNTGVLRVSDGAALRAESRGSFSGGNIDIQANAVDLTGGGQLLTSAFSGGDAGNITLKVKDRVAISGSNSDKVSLFNQIAQLDGKSIAERQLGSNSPDSGIFANTFETSFGKGGDVKIATGQLAIRDGAQVSASTASPVKEGRGGNLTIMADSIDLNGISAVDRSPSGLFTQTTGAADAGNLTINIGQMLVQNGAQASTSTSGQGAGGTLEVNAKPGSVELIGAGSRLSAEANNNAAGSAGSLTMTTGELKVKDQAAVTVSAPNGQAGNLLVTAKAIGLENQGTITAVTGAGEKGGNIILGDFDLLLMRRNSMISAQALNNANGGNITINAKNGFIVAVPSENSDILANAFKGNGGNINITTSGIYGLANRTQKTQSDKISEINASSDFGFDGRVEINTSYIDPVRGLVELPTNLVDPSNQIAQGCSPSGGGKTASRFIATGRGGLPLSPDEPLQGRAVIAGWVTLDSESENPMGDGGTHRSEATEASRRKAKSSHPATATTDIVEANGWVVDKNGDIYLIAESPVDTPHSPPLLPASCSQ